MFTAELISRILEKKTNIKIQVWNLRFVEAYQNSILRGQRILEKKTTIKIQVWNLRFVEVYQNSILRGQGLSI